MRFDAKMKGRFILVIALMLLLCFPALSYADADKVFKENSKAVVVVVAYDKEGKPISQGSGFIVRQDGAIVTNYHVISNASDIKVKAGNKVLKVEGLLYVDKENDIVILKAEAKGLPTVKIGDLGKANVGEKVYVISSPQGLENTISDGILSGIREIDPKRKILQITAPVSSGSSGGPVFNKNGEVIGVATFLIEEAQNLNFAMPIKSIEDVLKSPEKSITIAELSLHSSQNKESLKTDKSAEYHINLANNYLKIKEVDKAIEEYSKAIMLSPNDSHLYIARGILFTKNYDKAIADFSKAILIEPDNAFFYSIRGLVYFLKNESEKCIKDMDKAISLKPTVALFHHQRGQAYFNMGQYKQAIDDFTIAINLKPDSKDIFTSIFGKHLVQSLWSLKSFSDIDDIFTSMFGEYSLVTEDMDEFLKEYNLNDTLSNYYFERGKAFEKDNQKEAAMRDYEQSILISPEYSPSHSHLKELFQNNPNRCIDFYSKLLSKKPKNSSLLIQRAECYEMSGQINSAIKDIEQAIFLDPDVRHVHFSYSPHYKLMELYRTTNTLDKCISLYSKVIAMKPKDYVFYKYRAHCYGETKQYNNALKDYTKAIDLKAIDLLLSDKGVTSAERWRAEYEAALLYELYKNRGAIYLKLKHYDKAIMDYSKTIDFYQRNTDKIDFFSQAMTYGSRAEAYIGANKRDKAKADLEKACSLNYSCYHLGIFLKEEKRLAKAWIRGKNWVYIDSTNRVSFYYDKTRIKIQPNKRIRTWVRTEADDLDAFINDRKDKGLPVRRYQDFSHRLDLYEIDCDKIEIGSVSTIDYANGGEVLYTHSYDSKDITLKPIVPNSLGESLYEAVCQDKKKGKEKN